MGLPRGELAHMAAPPVPADIDPETGYGPAMRGLSPQWRAFVEAKVQHGLSNRQAAKAAGYADTSVNVLDATAYRLAHDPRVQAALHEETVKLMRAQGAKSVHVLIAMRDNPAVEAKDRIKCALELMNRSGLHAMTEQKVSVEHTLSDAEMDRRILSLCAELGIAETEARKMLVAPSKVKPLLKAETIATDATFEEVKPEDPNQVLDELLSPSVSPEPAEQE